MLVSSLFAATIQTAQLFGCWILMLRSDWMENSGWRILGLLLIQRVLQHSVRKYSDSESPDTRYIYVIIILRDV
jgi:hypothetical protein